MSLDEISDEIVAMSRSLEFSRLPPPTEVDDEFDSDMTYFGSVAAPLISAMVHDDGASRISLEGDGDGEVEYVSMSQQSTSSENGVTLEKDDIIVEKVRLGSVSYDFELGLCLLLCHSLYFLLWFIPSICLH